MAWSRILGHESVVTRFRATLARGRLSHAYLFVGPGGIGKELFARELAKAAQCVRGGDEACDACPACHKVEHGNHPDVAFIRREEGSGTSARRAQIVIGQVREEIQDTIAFKAFGGRYKVFVVVDAERMTEEAQNCLLKTLEEPPPHSLLILLASRLEPLMDTVISRCQTVRFRPLATEDVERILVGSHGVDPAQARVLARLCEGSPGRALAHQSGGALETARWLLDELAAVPAGAEFTIADGLLDKAKEQADSLEDSRDRLRPVLDLLSLAWRDLFLRASGYSDELLTWGTSCAALDALAARATPASALRLAALSIEARDRLDANANIKLLVEALLLETGSLLRGGEPLVVR